MPKKLPVLELFPAMWLLLMALLQRLRRLRLKLILTELVE